MLPAGALACLQGFSNYRQIANFAEESVLQAAVLSTRDEENVIIAARRMLRTLAALPDVTRRQPEQCDAALAPILLTSRFYASLAVTDGRGDIVCSAPSLDGSINLSQQSWYQNAVARADFTVTGDARGLAHETDVIAASLPTFDANAKMTGALVLAIRTEWLKELLADPDRPDITHIALIDRAGTVIASDAEEAASSSWLPGPGLLRANLGSDAQPMRILNGDLVSGVLAIAPLIGDELFVVVGSTPDLPTAGSIWRLVGAIGFPLIMWLIALAVAWFAVDRLVINPVLQLKETAAALAAGNREVRVSTPAELPAEISSLARTINTMADRLAERENALRRAVEEHKVLLKELHHRVKNNLQVITSLLNLQSHRSTGESVRDALRTAQDRIYALAKVHDNLDRSSEDGNLRLDQLIPQIADHMCRVQQSFGRKVGVAYDIDLVETSSERAVPIALLVTEAISSALDRCQPESGPGDLNISLKPLGETDHVLVVESTCPPTDPSAFNRKSLSAQLVAGFVKQLRGEMTLETETGYRLVITIPGLASLD